MENADKFKQYVWPLIFENFPINCISNREVDNQKLNHFTRCIHRLLITKDNTYNGYWDYNKESVRKEDKIDFKLYKQLRLQFNLDKNLKYLIIYKFIPNLNLKELSCLINLEQLEILHSFFDEDQFINLKNLKSFKLENKYDFKFILNTPKLTKIYSESIDAIEIENDAKLINHLITSNYNCNLKVFKNLEIIEINYFKDNIPLDYFTKLKKIKITDQSFTNSKMEKVLANILNDKNYLKRDIDVYFRDIKIENISKYLEILSYYDNLKSQIMNYDLLDSNLSTILRSLNYNQLENYFNDLRTDLPLTFFDKYYHLRIIITWQPLSSYNLNWFLINLRNLKELHLINVLLDQNFYDNLPDGIETLEIKSNKIINYKFILKLSNLVQFQVHNNDDLFDLSLESFSNLKYLKYFQFKFYGKNIDIEKSKNRFYLGFNFANNLDYNQLSDELNKIKMKHR